MAAEHEEIDDAAATIDAEARRPGWRAPRELPKLWDKAQVAERLGVPVSFVNSLVRKGELEVIPLGYRTHRITDTSLRAYLRKIGAAA